MSKPSDSSTRVALPAKLACLSLLLVVVLLGFRHQIRAHLEHLDYRIVCDSLYGDHRPLLLSELKRGYRPSARKEGPLLDRLALHAERLTFTHPSTGERMTVVAPLAPDIAVALKQLRRWAAV